MIFLLKRLFLIVIITSFASAHGVSTINNTQTLKTDSIQEKFEKLESSSGGLIGVSAINTKNNEQLQYRAEERFPLCSTSKLMVVAAILKKSMKDPNLLKKRIKYNQKDLDTSGYAPITTKHLTTGMSVFELCEAAMQYSDNTAMNLLMKNLGGLKAVNSFARSIGDNAFRLDRWEPDLNSAIPNDPRDTSTPAAMEKTLQHLALGGRLGSQQREQLQTWLKNNTTGDTRIRAGVPKNWIVGDKTGTGDYGATNDIGIIWPPKCAPIVVAIYFLQDPDEKKAAHRNDIIASVTRMLITEFARKDRCLLAS